METESPEFDIVISGAGPVGSALALLLARVAPRPGRIVLLARNAAAHSPPADPFQADPRTLALNHGSRALLEPLNAWPAQWADINTVHVSQRGRMGRALITHDELGVPRLGSVVAYSALQQRLSAAVLQSGITLFEADSSSQSGAQWRTAEGRTITSRLRVRSDGSPPNGVQRGYNQHALLATIKAGRPQRGWAYERFTNQGPLAILPHPQDEGLYALVWCCTPDRAQALLQQAEPHFSAELQQAFGNRLGRLQLAGQRHVFPLALNAGPSLIDARTLAIGNAAQTLHPVAGQGLNLGLRDAAQLAQALSSWLHHPSDDPAPLLRQFALQRRPDRWSTSAVTDFLPRIFATGNPLIEHACGLSLMAMDASRHLRAPLARHLLEGLRT